MFKGCSCMEGQPMMLEHNDEGDGKKSFELLTRCLRWVMLRWLARIIAFKDTSYKSDAWTESQFCLGSYTS